VLRFEVSGETVATFREAMAKIRRDAGESLDDDAALLLFSRHVLEGPRDEGRSSYQVALTVCDTCRRGTQQGRGESVEVSATAVEMAECDAQHIGHVGVVVGGVHVGKSGVHVTAPADDLTATGVHVTARADDLTAPGPHVHVTAAGDDPTAPSAHVDVRAEPARAKQSIPPARRRMVLRRDGGCCRVPGCRNATFVDIHHLRPRAAGGSNDSKNLVTLCGAHHHAIHDGKLRCEGTLATGLTFRHADGIPYGQTPVPRSADRRAQVFRALMHMGFREVEVREALGRVSQAAELAVDSLLREALRALVPATR
jgi:hypothetical protein